MSALQVWVLRLYSCCDPEFTLLGPHWKMSAYVHPSTWARILTTVTFIAVWTRNICLLSQMLPSPPAPWGSEILDDHQGVDMGGQFLSLIDCVLHSNFLTVLLKLKSQRHLKRTQVSLRYCQAVLSKVPPPWAHIRCVPGGGQSRISPHPGQEGKAGGQWFKGRSSCRLYLQHQGQRTWPTRTFRFPSTQAWRFFMTFSQRNALS